MASLAKHDSKRVKCADITDFMNINLHFVEAGAKQPFAKTACSCRLFYRSLKRGSDMDERVDCQIVIQCCKIVEIFPCGVMMS